MSRLEKPGRGAALRPTHFVKFGRAPSKLAYPAVSLLAALIGCWLYWGFTVDDALITARVAHHLRSGMGYRFNPGGEWVDAVTPLGWAHVLAIFAKTGPFGAWWAARILGVLSWLAVAAWLGSELRRLGGRLDPLLLLALLSPIGAWASAGMETGVIIALVTLSTGRGKWATSFAAICAALRPELIPFSVALAIGRAKTVSKAPLALVLSIAPAVFVAVIRQLLFGSPAPLSAVAKPADLGSGLFYSFQVLLLSGPFWLWIGPGWRKLPHEERVIAVAIVVHLIAVAMAGGDWMVLMRLAAPILPAALRIAAFLLRSRTILSVLPAWVCAIATTAFLGYTTGRPARRIAEQRKELITEGRRVFRQSHVVASLDVGWVGVAHPGAIVDLAGVTDPQIAHLTGGHTTKRIDEALLRGRHVDTWVLLLSPGKDAAVPFSASHFARQVEARVAYFAQDSGCVSDISMRLPFTTQKYLVVRCTP